MLFVVLSHCHQVISDTTPLTLVKRGKTRESRHRIDKTNEKYMSKRRRRRLEEYNELMRDGARPKIADPPTPWIADVSAKVESINIDDEEAPTNVKVSEAEQMEILRSKNGHKVKSWKDCKSTLYNVVDDYEGKVQDQYTTVWYDFSKSEISGHAPLSVEHIVPRSVVQRFTEVVQDLHNLIPVERNLNSRRSSYPYGPGNCRTDQSCLESNKMLVRDGIKGFIARSIIYVFVMYEKKLKSRNQRKWDVNAVGNMKMLVDWCLTFEPTEYEKNRNDRIEETQGNRNPFIDDTNLCKLALVIK